ncbi:amidase [Terrilactibacillus laevilacticus]|uniref:amidase n=1 Tax=Terrilactibacillus laevilacticus TaxID=1380157 RepID=UPI001FE5A374|nr:amidase [Terrilactibacillus laevilacticus]
MENKSMSFIDATVSDIHLLFRSNKLTSAELVDWYIQRIKKYDRDIKAIVTVNEQALQDALELDSFYQSTGEFKGTLHGIPVLVKDQGETAGLTTTFGSKAFENYIPEVDATVVKKLKKAGAIILAKTNLCDFAAGWFSFSSINDQTRNPYDLNRDAGGSSAGTSAGITANFGTIGIGEDTGGSARIPASFNNLFGLRVTTGLISRYGFSPLVHFQDTPGPITRSVRDMAKLLDVIAGYDTKDPFTSVSIQSNDIGNYEELLNRVSLKNVRIGILRQVFGSDEDENSRSVNNVVESAINVLKQGGAEIIDPIEVPNLDQYLEDTSLYTLQSKKDISDFLSSRVNTPLKSFMEVYKNKAFHPLNDLFNDIANGPDEPTQDDHYYYQRFAQEEFKRAIINALATYNIDTILFPDVRILPPTYEYLESGKWSSLTFPTNTVIASQTGLPAISVPGGFTDSGLPVGFELLGKPFSEGSLLKIAYAYEKICKPRKAPNLNSEVSREKIK